jgi:hypothetical protein
VGRAPWQLELVGMVDLESGRKAPAPEGSRHNSAS